MLFNGEALKISPPELAFDIDGVFADTMTLFLEIARHDFGIINIRYEDINDYDFFSMAGIGEEIAMEILFRIVEGKYSIPLYPMNGAPEVVKRLNRKHSPTLFVTARPDGGHVFEWMLGVLGLGARDIEVVATGSFQDKKDVLLERGKNIFIEDRLETCFMLKEAGISPVVYKQPWNRRPHPFPEVENWQDIESLIAFEWTEHQ